MSQTRGFHSPRHRRNRHKAFGAPYLQGDDGEGRLGRLPGGGAEVLRLVALVKHKQHVPPAPLQPLLDLRQPGAPARSKPATQR
eukprot:9331101-Pyramimonas_sp.AAC.1